MSDAGLLYLVEVQGGGARLVADTHVLSGDGVLRYGTKADLLVTAEVAEPAEGVALRGELIPKHSDRVRNWQVRFEGRAATVVLVYDRAPAAPERQEALTRHLLTALMADGVSLTAPRPTPAVPAQRVRVAPDVEASAAAWQPWLWPVIALLLGLALGLWLGTSVVPSGVEERQGPGPAVEQGRQRPTQKTRPTVIPRPAQRASVPGEPGPGDDPLANDFDEPEGEPGGEPESGHAPGRPAAPAAGAEGGAPKRAEWRALPKVSLWTAHTALPAGPWRCNRFGDLVASEKSAGTTTERVVVCGRFRKPKEEGWSRSTTCVVQQGAPRCAPAATLTEGVRPKVICAPKSGRACVFTTRLGPARFLCVDKPKPTEQKQCSGGGALYKVPKP